MTEDQINEFNSIKRDWLTFKDISNTFPRLHNLYNIVYGERMKTCRCETGILKIFGKFNKDYGI